jgi:hypothetical protein
VGSNFGLFSKTQFDQAFLGADFAFSFKKEQKSLSKSALFSLSEYKSYWCSRNPEFYADLSSAGIFHKKCTEKS